MPTFGGITWIIIPEWLHFTQSWEEGMGIEGGSIPAHWHQWGIYGIHWVEY